MQEEDQKQEVNMIRFSIQPEAKIWSFLTKEWIHLTPEAARFVHRGELTESNMVEFSVGPSRYSVKLEDVTIVETHNNPHQSSR